MDFRQLVVLTCLVAACAPSGGRSGGGGTSSQTIRQGTDHTGAGGDVSTVTAIPSKFAYIACERRIAQLARVKIAQLAR